jgi:hypothetical protein
MDRSCIFNPPEGMTVGQLTTVVGRWIEQRPQDWREPFFVFVARRDAAARLGKPLLLNEDRPVAFGAAATVGKIYATC